ncbi:11-beta-hydroxysteroid dehydrogenase type 2 isoform X2 [Daktulosphaira vitifoliae]|uniref:11-beta-hydroxysteroid dehydrogenase type 2 isoform X2 n=1 Tax=Daktulosphaira vitifoliae TaxID=58002 RepID=UPI0021AB0832|nr:11-beta-hydroxysteroid dehydrogenase type 2 isoform X2 [Daktulosphaira vitifoliae]
MIYFNRTAVIAIIIAATAFSLKCWRHRRRPIKDLRIPLIVITGCDTGLGYSTVVRYTNKNISRKIAIIALCLNEKQAKHLTDLFNNINLEAWSFDLRDSKSIKQTVTRIKSLIVSKNYKLHAVVNNAARMVMAEYEWQTINLIQEQFQVNVLGPMEFTSGLLSTLRHDQGRVINVVSHCALMPLPGIAIYGATKAAICAWTIGARAELSPEHGVKMIMFYPGSFYMNSSIMGSKKQREDYYDEILDGFSAETLSYYGKHVLAYKNYLEVVNSYIRPKKEVIPNASLYKQLDHALWSEKPRAEYKVPVPLRYNIYSTLSWISLIFGFHSLRDELIRRFMIQTVFDKQHKKQ